MGKEITLGDNAVYNNIRATLAGRMRQFYQIFPIRATVRHELSWSHYRLLMKIDEPFRREFYLNECAECNWSSRQLERQITTFYYKQADDNPTIGIVLCSEKNDTMVKY